MALSVAFSPNRTHLLTGHWDFKARLWRLESAEDPVVLPHDAPVNTTAFSPDGKTVLTGSYDGTVRLWDLTGRPLAPPLRHRSLVSAASFGAKGGTALVGVHGKNASRLWDLAPGLHDGPAGVKDKALFPLAFSPDCRTILTREAENTAQLRDATTGQPVGKPLRHQHPVMVGPGMSVVGFQRHACSSDRGRVVTVDEDNVARLWDSVSGKVLSVLRPEPNQAGQAGQPIFFSAAFSPDGKFLVTGNFLWTAHVWDAVTGERLHELEHEHHGGIRGVAFSPDGRILGTGGADSAVRFWDPTTGKPLGLPLRHSKGIFALSFSPDGKSVVTGGIDPVAEIWDVPTRSRRRLLTGHQAAVNAVAFSPDGRFILTGSSDNTSRLWDVATGKTIGPPMRHPGRVVRVAFSLDCATILTATEDERARQWKVPTMVTGTAQHVDLWVQVVTGLELEGDGSLRVLDAVEWHKRRQALQSELEGKPNP
jgi:WD40 repeat protein